MSNSSESEVLSQLVQIMSEDEPAASGNLLRFLKVASNRVVVAAALSSLSGTTASVRANSKRVDHMLEKLFQKSRASEEDRFSHTHISWQPSLAVLQRQSLQSLEALCIRYGAQPTELQQTPRRKAPFIQLFYQVLKRWKLERRYARMLWWRQLLHLPA
jgi:hypothetical protein